MLSKRRRYDSHLVYPTMTITDTTHPSPRGSTLLTNRVTMYDIMRMNKTISAKFHGLLKYWDRIVFIWKNSFIRRKEAIEMIAISIPRTLVPKAMYTDIRIIRLEKSKATEINAGWALFHKYSTIPDIAGDLKKSSSLIFLKVNTQQSMSSEAKW